MLSRLAESLFWMGRYIERAEDTARLLDVHFHTQVEQSQQTYLLRWDSIISISGEHERFFQCYREATPHAVFEFLGFHENNPNSIVGCVTRVRENARTIRDRISRELWEDINSFYHRIRAFRPAAEVLSGPHRFCTEVKFSSHQFKGVADDTLPHDEGWQFLRAGRALERAEKTARIVDVEYHTLLEGRTAHQPDNHQWMAVLKSCSALEAFCKLYVGQVAPWKVAEFLITHSDFPRSIRFCIDSLDVALHRISGGPETHFANEAERLSGRLRSEVDYVTTGEIFEFGLHQYLEAIQKRLVEVSEAMYATYCASLGAA
jgi:uncharacterized alpha-E superfamily protein